MTNEVVDDKRHYKPEVVFKIDFEKAFFFFFLIDKHKNIILKRGKQEGNPKHTGSIHEKPQKQKAQGSRHSPTLN